MLFRRSTMDNQDTSYAKGVDAENLVAENLGIQGYEILERRYKTKFGEIDLITRKENILCFVEVKSRKTLEDALLSVTAKNRRRIENSALFYISQNESCTKLDFRFDVVVITSDGEITHLDNAWLAGDN